MSKYAVEVHPYGPDAGGGYYAYVRRVADGKSVPMIQTWGPAWWMRRKLTDRALDRRFERHERDLAYMRREREKAAAMSRPETTSQQWSECGGGHAPLKPGDPPGCAYCPGAEAYAKSREEKPDGR